MIDVPHIITRLTFDRLTADEVEAEKAAGRPHPESTPIGPFRSRDIAEDYANGQIGLHGGSGSASYAPLRPAPVFRQPHPFEPPGLRALIESVAYKPGWEMSLGLFVEDGEPRGWAFYVISTTPNSYKPEETIRVRHEFLVPPASYNRDTWVAWLFDRIRDVETHEAGEFFMIDGVREFGPHHGNGEDPYRVWHVGDHEQARTKAGRDNVLTVDVTGRPRAECAQCGVEIVDLGTEYVYQWVHLGSVTTDAEAHLPVPTKARD